MRAEGNKLCMGKKMKKLSRYVSPPIVYSLLHALPGAAAVETHLCGYGHSPLYTGGGARLRGKSGEEAFNNSSGSMIPSYSKPSSPKC